MRSLKGSRRIVIHEIEYRWWATGHDGFIGIGIWPTNNIGSYLQGALRYHETWDDSPAGNQIIVTNRVIRRIIEYAQSSYNYDPQVQGKELSLGFLDDLIEWNDAVRAIRGKRSI